VSAARARAVLKAAAGSAAGACAVLKAARLVYAGGDRAALRAARVAIADGGAPRPGHGAVP